MKALDPNNSTAEQRSTEVSDLLSVAFVRLQQRKSSQKSADFRKSSLALSGQQRGHAEAVGRAAP
jgi:hypothetical protein